VNLDAVTVVGHIERGVDSIFKRPEIKKSSNAYFISELTGEWPEVAEIAKKLSRHEKLTEEDELWINELAEETGWDKDAPPPRTLLRSLPRQEVI